MAISTCSSPTTWTSRRRPTSSASIRAASRDYCGPRSYRPVPDRLFRNEGGGRFTDVTEAAGITKADGAGLGVATGDYNGDGWLDLYVANDATPNQLWMNQKNGTFVDEGPLAGVALNAAGVPEGSMGIASGDYDRDGDEDLFVTNIIGETFALYTNDGRGGLRGHARPVGARTADGGLYRVRHRLDRLRQRRLAGPVRRQRRSEHHRGTARRPGAVPDAQSAVSQSGHRKVRRDLEPGRPGIRTCRGRQGRRLRRHRQRRRHRRSGDQQHGARPPVAESSRHTRSWLQVRLDNGPATASVSAPSCTWSELARRRTSFASVPTAAISSAQDPTLQFGLGEWRGPVTVRVDWPGGARSSGRSQGQSAGDSRKREWCAGETALSVSRCGMSSHPRAVERGPAPSFAAAGRLPTVPGYVLHKSGPKRRSNRSWGVWQPGGDRRRRRNGRIALVARQESRGEIER